MRIVVISTPIFKLSTHGIRGYGGLEQLAAQQAWGLGKRGHEVFLVAPDGSDVEGVTTIPCGPEKGVDERYAYGGFPAFKDQQGNIARPAHPGYWQHLLQADVVIDHSWQKQCVALKMEGRLKCPVLLWLHAPAHTMFGSPPPVEKPCVVCISDDQRRHYEALHSPHEARTCYNGCFEANTLIYPEGKLPEKIAAYVGRSGRERVLALDESSGEIIYTEVRQTLQLQPTNSYAVHIITESGLTLTSTPDNPIMTTRGWVEATKITTHDVVICETRQVDRHRDGIHTDSLWTCSSPTNCHVARETSNFGEQHSKTAGTETDASTHKSFVDRGRRGNSSLSVQNKHRRRTGRCTTKTLDQRDSIESSSDETHAIQNGLVQRKNAEGDQKTYSDGSSLYRRTDRRRGTRLVQCRTGKKKSQHSSESGNSEHRFTDRRFCQEQFTSDVFTGTSQKHDKCCEKQTTDLEDVCHRHDCRGCTLASDSLHDCEEVTSRSGCEVLPNCDGGRVEGWLHRRANQITSIRPTRELTTRERVVEVRRIPTPTTVFDLQTSTGNFVANGIVVHNCDSNFYQPMPGVKRTNRFLFLARFSTIKGAGLAIDACRQVGVGLDLVGDTTITSEPDYFEMCKKGCDGKQIRMVGPATRGECVRWFSQAHCLLHPNFQCKERGHPGFREPFGLAPVEAMLCGTPVIAGNYGAMRETVKHGETGWLVKNYDDFVKMVTMCGTPPHDELLNGWRTKCREWASKFSINNMVTRVEELCHEAIQTGGW